jgi:hypothetical protein
MTEIQTINDIIDLLEVTITRLEKELPQGGTDPTLKLRTHSNLHDLRICIEQYHRRIERE